MFQDYPSVAEINRAVKRNKINVIFAIPQKVHHAYRKLSSRVEGSVVGQLAESADNIIQIVKDEYKVNSALFSPITNTKFPHQNLFLEEKHVTNSFAAISG